MLRVIRHERALHTSRCFSSGIDISSLTYNRDNGYVYGYDSEVGTKRKHRPLFQTIIGIEVHAQLRSNESILPTTKLFSPTVAAHNEASQSSLTAIVAPNSAIHPFDISYPGFLPRLSQSSVQSAILSAAALECKIHDKSRFERKHYHYPDLPLGYQMTQQRWPLASGGTLKCRRWFPPEAKAKKTTKKRRNQSNMNKDDLSDPEVSSLTKFFSVGIDRIQIEQDTGKTTSVDDEGTNIKKTLIDFNRAGSTLIEIVFLPQIKSAHEAVSVVSTLQGLLKHIRTCDGKMEEGSLRCDLNVSIAPYEDDDRDTLPIFNDVSQEDMDNPFRHYLPSNTGHRVEVKNLNSMKQVLQSTEHEVLRQALCRLQGGRVARETRTFDPRTNETIKIRDKTAAVDYRFMPEPDLPPIHLDHVLDGKSLESFLHDELPELPESIIKRFMECGVSEDSAIIITSDRHAISFFEESVQACLLSLHSPNTSIDSLKVHSTVANFLCNDLLALVKDSLEYSRVSSHRFGALTGAMMNETISSSQAKKILSVMFERELDVDPVEFAVENDWILIKDPLYLKAVCRDVVMHDSNKKQLDQYKQGGKHTRKIYKFFVGKVMKETNGNAHPNIMNEMLREVLNEIAPDIS